MLRRGEMKMFWPVVAFLVGSVGWFVFWLCVAARADLGCHLETDARCAR
jgi:hypothetical protein